MSTIIYVEGLSYSTKEKQLQTLFEDQGGVTSAVVITDRDTGHCKGFSFVEMSFLKEATKAIGQLNGENAEGRSIMINQAE